MKVKKEWVDLIKKCFREDESIRKMDEYLEWEQERIRQLDDERKEIFDALNKELEGRLI